MPNELYFLRRDKRGLSTFDFFQITGLPVAYFVDIERGWAKPGVSDIECLALLYGVSELRLMQIVQMERLLLPSFSVTKEVMQSVTDYAYNRNSRIPRSVVVDQWNLSDEEYDQCEFEDGYLVIDIVDIQIVQMEFEYGIQTWTVECCVDLGYDFSDVDGYSAYKNENGEWVIEWDYC